MSNDLADFPEGDTWFTEVDYQGAFSKDDNWLAGWTYLSEAGYLSASADAGAELVNLSTRVVVGSGETVTVGFTVTGGSQNLMIRAVGPKLADLGVSSPLADPQIQIFNTDFSVSPPAQIQVGGADNWVDENTVQLSATMSYVGAFPLEVAEFQGTSYDTVDETSAAITGSFDTGVYTIQVTSVDGGEGEVLIEVYSVD